MLAAGAFAVAWALTPIPDSTQPEATAQASVIYYRDGKTVLAKQGVNRKRVELAKVPKHLRDAVIAVENRSFYRDSGVSISGTARAVWSTVTGQQLQGGSTITQQMVRNYYSGLGQERSIVRKLKEIMISLKVDQSKSKDWVLEQYLNTIYFGRSAWGVQAAAEAYFRKDVSELTVAESAYLAAVIQQPSNFANPTGATREAAEERWKSVIAAMRETGALTAEEAADQRFPTLKKPKAPFTPKGQQGYMIDQVNAEMARRGYTEEQINQDGLRIVTTFDKNLMAAAERAVTSVLPDATPKKVRTGLAAVDPDSGEVLAFYGGRSWEESQFDNAFYAKVQAGSTFKAYALAAALEDGVGLSSRFDGNSPLRVASADQPIPNSSGRSYGQVNLVTATRESVNTAFVDLGQQIGLNKVADAAKAAGIPESQLSQHEQAATFPLGVASVSAVQQAAGYATFASQGIYHEPHVIRSITSANDKKTTIKVAGKRAFSEQTAADTTYAMTQVVQAGTGTAARLWDRPAAGKTGTTDKSGAAWFVGYTPQLSTAVNMFRDDNKTVSIPGYGAQYGGGLPAQIWRAFMAEAMSGKPVEQFPEPSDMGWGDSGNDGTGSGDWYDDGSGDGYVNPDQGTGRTEGPDPQPSTQAPEQSGNPTGPPDGEGPGDGQGPGDGDPPTNPGDPGNPNPGDPDEGQPGDTTGPPGKTPAQRDPR
ncbi:Membrane carboxypeptidase (penicillin-binding protein) [Sinosporangium album]|uniref:Membrane carboxypeptidase (Penicillin-binding protein) n=1 Tax=Sinosporangium album TaxID=504805 RepID=A0A1G8AMF3_9ACTN|nr:transglycosylase domain-containing protein [Sinosporangium album]SDH22151.1 Membrane carboxypeptidase (penicillin-binding protein) [Sinosporangium album]